MSSPSIIYAVIEILEQSMKGHQGGECACASRRHVFFCARAYSLPQKPGFRGGPYAGTCPRAVQRQFGSIVHIEGEI